MNSCKSSHIQSTICLRSGAPSHHCRVLNSTVTPDPTSSLRPVALSMHANDPHHGVPQVPVAPAPAAPIVKSCCITQFRLVSDMGASSSPWAPTGPSCAAPAPAAHDRSRRGTPPAAGSGRSASGREISCPACEITHPECNDLGFDAVLQPPPTGNTISRRCRKICFRLHDVMSCE